MWDVVRARNLWCIGQSSLKNWGFQPLNKVKLSHSCAKKYVQWSFLLWICGHAYYSSTSKDINKWSLNV
jgi:hypothetical protein